MMPKRRRDQRDKQPARMELTARDIEIIHAVYQYRILTQSQIQRLFFGSKSAAQHVLARLYHHRLLDRRFLPVSAGRSPTFYVLDRKGVEVLRSEHGLVGVKWYNTSKDLAPDFLAHRCAINDFRILVTLAAQAQGYPLLQWINESELRSSQAYDYVTIRSTSGRPIKVSLIPDSYFVLQTPNGKAHFFLELDRKQEELEVFRRKVQAYSTYLQTGGYERRYQSKGVRILTVVQAEGKRQDSGKVRLANLKTLTEKEGGRRRFWFTRLHDLTPDTILTAPVWQVAGDEASARLIE
jgi:DNA-binding MarR family transcriptional regulator